MKTLTTSEIAIRIIVIFGIMAIVADAFLVR
jgi:hypothetical protein